MPDAQSHANIGFFFAQELTPGAKVWWNATLGCCSLSCVAMNVSGLAKAFVPVPLSNFAKIKFRKLSTKVTIPRIANISTVSPLPIPRVE